MRRTGYRRTEPSIFDNEWEITALENASVKASPSRAASVMQNTREKFASKMSVKTAPIKQNPADVF